MKKFATVLVLLLITVILGATLIYVLLTRPYSSNRPFPITVEIPPGTSVHTIAQILQREGVIRWQWSVRLWLKIHPQTATLHYGRYRFDGPHSLPQVLEKLQRGQVELMRITIREGLSLQEVSQFLAGQFGFSSVDFLKESNKTELIHELDPKASDLEGYLFPETYLLDPSATAADLVRLMASRFVDQFSRNMQWRARDIGLSNRQVVTLASLIEMETAKREERFLISSVFHNRLRLKMRLDCDPTIVYAVKRDQRWHGSLGWDELKYDSPYNTRLYNGLPPGPICAPGLASLEAALYPEQTDYLFFVAKGDGSHYFSRNLKEHNQAVQRYIINAQH